MNATFAWVLVPVAIYAMYQGVAVGLTADRILGPGFFPFCIGALLLVGAGMLVLEQRRATPSAAEQANDEPSDHEQPDEQQSTSRRPFLLHVAAMAMLILTIVPLGLVTAISLYLVGTLKFIAHRSWLTTVAVTAGAIIIVWVGMGELLGVTLITGPLGF
ncbi:tripartite tricarboxylate transporter TctB family protein [Mycolicibacterium sp. XJ870]